jgi:hypothetical protein
MRDRGMSFLILGIILGGLGAILAMGGIAFAWGWHAGAAAHGHDLIMVPTRAALAQELNPKEFVPLPNRGTGPGAGPGQQVPGSGGQDCARILFFYQGRLYQLRPGPTPRNGGNPEFFFMQPYEGPQLPGFPGPAEPGVPGQSLPPTLKF